MTGEFDLRICLCSDNFFWCMSRAFIEYIDLAFSILALILRFSLSISLLWFLLLIVLSDLGPFWSKNENELSAEFVLITYFRSRYTISLILLYILMFSETSNFYLNNVTKSKVLVKRSV